MGWGNLGIAMGAGAEEMKDQRKLAMMEAAEGRATEEFGRKKRDWGIQDGVEAAQRQAVEDHRNYIESIGKGDHMSVADALSKYHTGSSYLGDTGSQIFKGGDGKDYIAAFQMGAGKGMPEIREITPDLVKQHAGDVLRHRLETADSRRMLETMDKQREYGLKVEDARVKKDTNDMHREHYQRADATQELYRQNQAPLLQSQARYYDRMPNTGGGGGSSEQPLSKEEQATLMALQAKYAEAAEGSPEQRNIAKQYQLAQNGMMLQRGRAPNLPAGMVVEPRQTAPAKPVMEFKDYVTQFPPGRVGNRVETDTDVLKRYNSFVNGGLSASDRILAQMSQQGAPQGQASQQRAPQSGTSFSPGHSSQGLSPGRVGQNPELADIQMRLAQPGISDATKYELQMRQNAILYPDRRGFSPMYKPQM